MVNFNYLNPVSLIAKELKWLFVLNVETVI